jgi:hypothetical protein
MALSIEARGNDVSPFKTEVSAEPGTSAFGGSEADPDVETQTILTQSDRSIVRSRSLPPAIGRHQVCNARSNHSQRLGRRIRDVDNSSGNVRTAVIDPNCHGPSTGDVGHAQSCSEWQRWMRGGQIVRIELFAARGLCPLCVEAGNSLRNSLCLGRIVVRREPGVPFYGRDTSVNTQ